MIVKYDKFCNHTTKTKVSLSQRFSNLQGKFVLLCVQRRWCERHNPQHLGSPAEASASQACSPPWASTCSHVLEYAL